MEFLSSFSLCCFPNQKWRFDVSHFEFSNVEKQCSFCRIFSAFMSSKKLSFYVKERKLQLPLKKPVLCRFTLTSFSREKIALLSRVFISFLALLREKSSFVPSPHKQTRRGAESLATNSAQGGGYILQFLFSLLGEKNITLVGWGGVGGNISCRLQANRGEWGKITRMKRTYTST